MGSSPDVFGHNIFNAIGIPQSSDKIGEGEKETALATHSLQKLAIFVKVHFLVIYLVDHPTEK